jgi:hypothetical protein
MADLDELAAHSESREGFVRFLDALRADLRKGAGDWAYPELEPFLESLGAWLTDSGRFDDLDAASWRAFADMLLAARVYE